MIIFKNKSKRICTYKIRTMLQNDTELQNYREGVREYILIHIYRSVFRRGVVRFYINDYYAVEF